MFIKKKEPEPEEATRRVFESLYFRSNCSYMYNDVLLKQGCAECTAEFQYHKKLHEYLNIMAVSDENCELKRIGRNFDGGYILLYDYKRKEFSKNKIAYSLGICDDVSFDLDMVGFGYDIFQYDHTIDCLPQKHERFHWKKIGVCGENETTELKRLETLIRENGHENTYGMLLKADVEGAEWEMIMNCKEITLSQFDQIVIEFHNLLDYQARERVLKSLEKLSKTHQTIHIHANNNSYVGFSGELVTPNVLEATLVLKNRYRFKESKIALPISLDHPCRAEFNEILLGYWNNTKQ